MRASRVALHRGPPIPAIPMQFDGVSGFAEVDTGCQMSIISPRLATELGHNLSSPPRTIRLAGVGITPAIPVVTVGRIEVGAFSQPHLDVCVMEPPAVFRVDAFLGLDFLRHYRVTFEFDTMTLILRDPRGR
jgi:hypothetical protein